MRVWVTRSLPGADRLAAALRAAGHEPVVAPVLEIEPLTVRVPPGPYAATVFVSEHAVVCGAAALAEQSDEVLAVGRSTAAALRRRGVEVRVPDREDSEGLLTLLPAARVRGRTVLLVVGADGRDLLAAGLTERGARVRRLVCYRRQALADLTPELRRQLAGIEVIVAASGDGLRQIGRLWADAGGDPSVPVLVPSQRVLALGVELGLRNLHDCGGAGTDAVLGGLAALQQMGSR
ncbi:MAG: uroporphyrinogen-III synthase [Pseudomonadales bacterium]